MISWTFPTDLALGAQPHMAPFTITHVGAKTVSGGGLYRTDWFGHYWFLNASGSQSEQFAGEQSLRNSLGGSYPYNSSNKTGLRGFVPKLRWDWIESGDGVYQGAGVAQLDNHYDYCDANGFICWPDITDTNFGGNTSWDHTKSFAPTYIENSNGAMVGGNPSNISASAKLHVSWVMDKFIACLLFLHNRYKDRPSYVGITVPETTRAEHTGGSLSDAGNYQNIDSPMYTEFSRMITEYRAGAPGSLLKIQYNYLGSLLDDLVEDGDTAGGVIIGTPDVLRNKSVAIYPLIRDKDGIMGVHVHWETREIENSPDTAWDFCFNDSDKLNPQAITHFSWHPNNGNWESDTLNKLQAENWFVNQTIPSDLSGGGGSSTVGTNPAFSIVSFSGSTLTIEPKSTTTTSDVDSFSVWDGDTEYTATVTFFDSDPGGGSGSDGQQTSYEFFPWKPGASDVSGSGLPEWIESTEFAGYTGGHHLKSSGGYNAGTQDDYRNGKHFVYDTANLPDGDWWIYVRGRAFSVSSDSFWLEIEGVPMPNGSDQFWHVKDGTWTWQALQDPTIGIGTVDQKQPRTFSNTDGLLKFWNREEGFAIDKIIFVRAGETLPPQGEDGYYSIVWPGTTTVTEPADATILETQGIELEFIFDIDPLIESWTAVVPASSDNAGLQYTTGSSTPVAGSTTQWSLKSHFLANTAGTYTVTAKITSGPNEFEGTCTVTVNDPASAVWPEGVSATIPTNLTVGLGGTITIDADPQNIPGHSLLGDRWSISNSNLSFDSSTEDIATFRADAIGTSIITYRMERDDNPADPIIYTTNVTITTPQVIMPDSYVVTNNVVAFQMDVLQNDLQSRIVSFTQPASGQGTVTQSGNILLYDPPPGWVGNTSFTYTADDGNGGSLDTSNVDIQVVAPASFDSTFIGSIGPNRAGIRGTTFALEFYVVENPVGYNFTVTWGEGFTADGRLIATWKDGKNTGTKVALEISGNDVSLEEVLANVYADASEA